MRTMRWWLIVLLAWVFPSVSFPVHAQASGSVPESATQTLVLSDAQPSYPLGRFLDILIDPTAQLTIDDVTAPEYAARFVRSQQDIPNFGYTDAAIWVRLSLQNMNRQQAEWRLVLDFPNLQHVTFYRPRAADAGFDVCDTGILHPFASRDIPSRHFVFRLTSSQEQTYTVYLRVLTDTATPLALTLWSPAAFAAQAQREYLFEGIFLGILVIMAGYNLFLGIFLRDRSYLYYVGFLLTFLLYRLSITGLGSQYLWPDLPWINRYSVPLWTALVAWCVIKFAMTFLHVRAHASRLYRVLVGLEILWYVLLAQIPVVRYKLVVQQGNVAGLVTFSLAFAAGVIMWRKGFQAARYYTLGWITLLTGFYATVFVYFGWLPANALSEQYPSFGILALVLLLSMALSDRINLLKQQEQAAQTRALHAIVEQERLVREQNATLEQMMAERTYALQESEARYRCLFEDSPIALWDEDFSAVKVHLDQLKTTGVTDFERYFADHPEEVGRYMRMMQIVNVNRATLHLFGAQDLDELIAHLPQIFGPQALSSAAAALAALTSDQPVFEAEVVNYTLTGEPMDLLLRSFISPAGPPGAVRIIVAMVDITDRKQAEHDLRESERTYRLLAENMDDVVWTLDLQGRFTYVSPSVERLRGYTVAEVMAQPMHEALTPASLEIAATNLQIVYEHAMRGECDPYRRRYELEQPCKDGSTVWTEAVTSVMYDEAGQFVGVLGVTRDITARKRIENDLRKFSRAVEQSGSTIVITDLQGSIEYVNPAFCRITGYAEHEALGQNPRILKSGAMAPEVYQELWATITRGDVWQGELLNKNKQGDFYWEFATISPIKDAAGTITHYIGVKEDITLRKQAEVQLREAKEAAETANRAKSVFLANMSHELRTPLNGILGYAQLLQREPVLHAQYRQYAETIERSGQYLLTLINDILDLAKVEAGRVELVKEDFDLRVLIRDLEALMRVRTDRKGLTFRVEFAPDVPHDVHGDPHRLRQILLNLLGNAVKFTEHGNVELRITNYELRHEQSEIRNLKFEISDTGIGIAPEELARIFEPFHQAGAKLYQQQGTGLGLTITRNLIGLMSGELTVNSTVRQGSVFICVLPLPVARGEATVKVPTKRRPIGMKGAPPTILIVDDQADNRAMLVDVLTPLGFLTRTATDGVDALRQMRAACPTIVITDVRMPGMDGLELIRQIRATPEFCDVPIIAASASVYHEDRQRCLDVGSQAFLPKPINADDLFDVLQRLLALEWCYAEEIALPESAPILAPSPDQLIQLLEILRIGDVIEFGKQLDAIRQTDPPFLPFVNTFQPLLDNFRLADIRRLLEKCQAQYAREQGNVVPTSERVAALPLALQIELQQAVRLLDIHATNQVITRIKAYDSPLSDILADIVAQFRFDLLETFLAGDSEAGSPVTNPAPLPEALNALPHKVIRALEQAARLGDADGIEQALAQIRAIQPALAETLAALAAEFDYGNIVREIEKLKGIV